MRYTQFVLILSCLLFQFRPSYSQTGREIVDRYLDTVSYGDVDKWSRIKTFYSTSRGTFGNMYPQFGGQVSGEVSFGKTYKQLPDQMKEESYKDSLFQELTGEFYYFRSKKVIYIGNMPPMEVIGDNARFLEFLPATVQRYVKESKSITYNGIKILPGVKSLLHEVEIQTRDEIKRFFFNADSFLLEAMAFSEVDIIWFYADYKDIDGFLMPMRSWSSNNGNVFSTTEIMSASFDQPMDKNKFKLKSK